MTNLFEQKSYSDTPLADRMRPRDFNEFYGQEHLIGKDKPLRKIIEADKLTSIILWGPPGTGKTTIARIIAAKTNSFFEEFSAVTSGINDLRRVVGEAKERKQLYNLKTVLFVDEIHRFNKSQQDGFLPHIENGTLVLVGATTENPGFEINSALLSRSSLFELKKLEDLDLKKVIKDTLSDQKRGLGKLKLKIDQEALNHLIRAANGDARTAINALEMAGSIKLPQKTINQKIIAGALTKKVLAAYKKGEVHYDVISAFIKSMRGSDPDAVVYWLARMIEAEEDPKFIARRMIIFASEDIGNAAPMALILATACFEAVNTVGLPEARINLSQCAIYLACAPKSNASYLAIDNALSDLQKEETEEVPKHLKNAPTKLAKELGYGRDYQYPHDFKGSWIEQDYLPQTLKNKHYYRPTKNGAEAEIAKRLAKKRKKK
jgi:putative ATPase